ncbi:hypothetical protein CsatA_005967 [Cannabis sativa]
MSNRAANRSFTICHYAGEVKQNVVEQVNMEIERSQEISADVLPFARSYQLEALESGMKQNTVVYLETGSGETLIAIMLLRSYARLLRKPSQCIAVFLVPRPRSTTPQSRHQSYCSFTICHYAGELLGNITLHNDE